MRFQVFYHHFQQIIYNPLTIHLQPNYNPFTIHWQSIDNHLQSIYNHLQSIYNPFTIHLQSIYNHYNPFTINDSHVQLIYNQWQPIYNPFTINYNAFLDDWQWITKTLSKSYRHYTHWLYRHCRYIVNKIMSHDSNFSTKKISGACSKISWYSRQRGGEGPELHAQNDWRIVDSSMSQQLSPIPSQHLETGQADRWPA